MSIRAATLSSIFACALALPSPPALPQSATGCSALTSIPFREYVDYTASIQPIFDNACVSCHSSGSTFLDLSSGQSAASLIGVPSGQLPLRIRVVAGQPMQSLLRSKVQCALPEVGERMPLDALPLTLFQQALIYDWIAAGAPVESEQRIFVGGFESRP